jgi:exosortase
MSTFLAAPGATVASGKNQIALWQFLPITVLVAIVYGKVLAGLASEWWTQDSATYGILIPPAALYVAWTRRNETLGHAIRPDNRGLWLIAAATLLYTLGSLGAEFFLPRVSFVVLLAGLVWTFWGVARLKSLSFPLTLLVTMVPLPALISNVIAVPLQLLASDLATRVAQSVGVSVFRDGNVLTLANMSLGVEEACSGLNSLSALIVGSVLLGFLLLKHPLFRFTLFALTIPLAIAVNVVRVTGTAILADSHQEIAEGFYHGFSGWLVFVVGFGAQYLVTLAFAWWENRRTA